MALVYRIRGRGFDRRKRFFRAILEGLKTGSVLTIDDVVDLYKGIFISDSEVLDTHVGLSTCLRQFLVELLAGSLGDNSNSETLVKWKERVSEFIRISEERSPFEGLPPYERNILRDLNNYINTQDHDSIKRKLLELGGVLHTRLDHLNRIRNINRWSFPITMVGMILTVVFGVVAITK
jgi:hypothetical protein